MSIGDIAQPRAVVNLQDRAWVEWFNAVTSALKAFGRLLSAPTGTATLDFGSIGGGASATLTITVLGVRATDISPPVLLGLPAAPSAGIVYTPFVSGDDTVTVRASNLTGGAIDPPSGVYRATVLRY